MRDKVTTELQGMLAADLIESIDASPWVSNLVIVQKRSGGMRLCIDLRGPNKAVVPDKYPLSTIEELTTLFYGSSVFTKLDLKQGYMQIPLHEDSRNLTAFVTHMGLFRFKRITFGLSSAPSCFQKIMATVLAGLPGTAVYLDDIVVHGKDVATHDECLRRVFTALSRHNLTLNTEKCVFATPAIDFVGLRVSSSGIAPLQSNVEAILNLQVPTSAGQLASFLGMTAYYLRFLPQYSEITSPLQQLLKHNTPWTADCEQAIRRLTHLLTSPPTLAHFDLSSPTLVTCDASAVAVGAVLSQLHDGIERPIAFASRALSSAEQKYSVGEREALACIWACERWHMYLYGRSFTLRTDHQALTTLMSSSGTGHKPLRLHRWADRLNQYNYQLLFTPGKDNVVADFLSRSAVEPTSTAKQPESDIERDLVQLVYEPLQAAVSLEELQRESAADPLFVTLSNYIQNGWPARVSADLTPFSRVRAELTCWGESCIARGHRAVIPLSLRGRVLSMSHEGHLGIVKLKQRCRDLVWWPGIDRELEALVRDCAPCLLSGKTGAPAPPPLQPVDWPTKPWEHLQMDICGELASVPHHQRFLVVVYDLHSKWPEVVPMGSVTASAIVDFLEQLFSRWGMLRAITTDNGPQFVSSEFSSYLAARGIAHIRTAFYHPAEEVQKG